MLYKTSSVVVEEGVIGRRCVEWRRNPGSYPDPPQGTNPRPPSPEPPPDNTDTLPPDTPRPTTQCPRMTIFYVWQPALNSTDPSIGQCMAIRRPADPSISAWPASCGDIWPVSASNCGR